MLPTAAALEGLPELARNRVKLLFQSQRQLTAARQAMTFLSDKVDMGVLNDGEAGSQVDDEHDALLVLVACQAEEDVDAAELMNFFKAGVNSTILVFNPVVLEGGSYVGRRGGGSTLSPANHGRLPTTGLPPAATPCHQSPPTATFVLPPAALISSVATTIDHHHRRRWSPSSSSPSWSSSYHPVTPPRPTSTPVTIRTARAAPPRTPPPPPPPP